MNRDGASGRDEAPNRARAPPIGRVQTPEIPSVPSGPLPGSARTAGDRRGPPPGRPWGIRLTPGTASQTAASRYWREHGPRLDRRPRPEQPVCLLMAGVPLAGKTTLARRLVEAIDPAAVHVENDRLRPRVAERLGHDEPVFSGDENHATYQAAREVLEAGLEAGFHVVHDATNLDESDRRPAYELADTLEVPVRVLFVQAPRDVRQRRAEEAGPAARQAHEALGDRQPSPEACTREHRVLDGTRAVDRLVDEVLADEAFDLLSRER